MSAAAIAIIVVVAVVVLVVSAMTITRRRLQRCFGPEYDRVVREKRSQIRGAAELARRERRVQRLRIHPLTASARAEYAAEWRAVQEGFVDQPDQAVFEGQELVATVMKERGYPAEDPGRIMADLSVTHARTLDLYRAAWQISEDASRGDASTEDLRQAFIHYRAVFGELLGKPDAAEPRELPKAGPPVPGAAEPPLSEEVVAPEDAVVPKDAVVPEDAEVPDGAGRAPDGAGGPAPEAQLWRPAIQVPRPRTSVEETAQ